MKLELRNSSFKEGLKSMMNVSYSIEQSILEGNKNPLSCESDDDVRRQTILNLAENVSYNNPTTNCKLEVNEYSLRYTTNGGLTFGWWINLDYDEWCFWIQHPSGKFTKDSTLLKSGLKNGWEIAV